MTRIFTLLIQWRFRNAIVLSLLICLSVALGSEHAAGQTTTKRTITGTIISSEDNLPVIGATISLKNTLVGTASNMDGKYTINVEGTGGVLVFSYTGMKTVEIAIGDRTVINAVLEPSLQVLDEIVVVAYGTQRKSTVAGSLTTVKTSDIKTTAPNVSAMLQGQVAGMNVSQNSGKPGEEGKITIRGRGSISSRTEPLWVVDGIVGGLTSSLNPDDIEAITVLKDASATALYGSRGANGAIVVTTKRGKLGEKALDVSVKIGFTNLTRGRFKMMNSKELYDYTDMMFRNTPETEVYPWFTPALKDNDVDWWKIATQTGIASDYYVSYRTGSEKIRSYLSVGYYKETGAVKGYDYERFTVKNNITYKVSDKFNITSSISGNLSQTYDTERSIHAASTYLPWDTPRNSLGKIKTGKEGQDISTGKPMSDYWFGRDMNNYLYDNQLNYSKNKIVGIDVALGFDYRICKGLVFESQNNFGYKSNSSVSYTDPKSMSGLSDRGTIYNGNSYTQDRYTSQILRYNGVFNNVHEVGAYLGHEYSDTWYRTNSLTGKGIPSGGKVPGVSSEPKSINGDEYYNNKTEGYFFNTNYVYDNRYFAQLSFRRDGSSKFGRKKRYGNFWTIGGGWNINNEKFVTSKNINQMRLRMSYGMVGNTPDGTFLNLYLYDLNREYDLRPGAFPKQMGNQNISWETAKTTNIGFDVRMFDRVGLDVDFYIKNVTGLLYNRMLSTLSGYSNVWVNEGHLRNAGVEFTLSTDVIKTKDWHWTIDFNFAYNKNKIKSLAGGKEIEIYGNHIRQVGYPVGTYYMREWGGVDVGTGSPTWVKYDDAGNKTYVTNDSETTTYNLNKSRYPNITGGAQTMLSYKGLTLSATFAYAAGFYIYHSGRAAYDNDGAEPRYNSMVLKSGWSRWEKPGDRATHPKPKIGGNENSHTESSRYLEKGDFFKMKTLGLSYSLPQKWMKLGMRSASVGFSVDNLFTITQFSGIDPEVAVSGDSYDASRYPLPRKFMFSISLGF